MCLAPSGKWLGGHKGPRGAVRLLRGRLCMGGARSVPPRNPSRQPGWVQTGSANEKVKEYLFLYPRY